MTTADLAEHLGITETAVRRHIDNLYAEGLLESRDGMAPPRRRGRPAKAWVVSPSGHRVLVSDYDALAGAALAFLAETAGGDAVQAFAERRLAELEARCRPFVEGAGIDIFARVEALVEALTSQGYAASARPVGGEAGSPGPLTGIQICQGHCPVQHVASQFPQFCDTETEAFSRLLGVHVQRLSTLAQGAHVCTTFVPTSGLTHPLTAPASAPAPTERSPR